MTDKEIEKALEKLNQVEKWGGAGKKRIFGRGRRLRRRK